MTCSCWRNGIAANNGKMLDVFSYNKEGIKPLLSVFAKEEIDKGHTVYIVMNDPSAPDIYHILQVIPLEPKIVKAHFDV